MKYTYLLIDFLIIVFPFLLSFDRKVGFYKKFKTLLLSMILANIPIIFLDFIATKFNIWGFNEKYFTGIKVYNLPIEEILFFFVSNFAVIFIYEVFCSYKIKTLNHERDNRIVRTGLFWFNISLLLFSILLGLTLYTTVVTSLFLILVIIEKMRPQLITLLNFAPFVMVVILPFLIINFVLTYLPVVIYNPLQITGIRITSIPIEDFIYNYLMIFINLKIYLLISKRKL